MKTSVPRSLRKSSPMRAFAIIRRVMVATLMIIPLIVAPVFAYPATTLKPVIVQDDEVTGQWVKMKPTGAWASFEMPKKPRYIERRFTPIPDKPPIKVRLHLVTVADGNLTYVFSYHDLHAKPIDSKSTLAAINGAVRGSVANVLGQLVDPVDLGLKTNPQSISQNEHVGRQFVCRFIQDKKLYIATGRVFLVGKRLYQLNCIMPEDMFDPNLAARFLRSFKIIIPEDDSPPRPRVTQAD